MKKLMLVLVVVGVLLFAGITRAQNPYTAQPNWISEDDQFTMSVAMADLDNDGDLDLLAGNYNYPYAFEDDDPGFLQSDSIGARLVAYRSQPGQPDGLAAGVNLTTTNRCIDCIAVGDYDSDGDMDIAVGLVVGKGGDGGVWVLKNKLETFNIEPPNVYIGPLQNLFDSTPYFASSSYDAHVVRWVDYNGDGALELAAMEIPGKVHFYKDDGNGFSEVDGSPFDLYTPLQGDENIGKTGREFIEITDFPHSGTLLEFGDIDDDGLLDLLLNVKGQPVIYKNVNGLFSEITYEKDESEGIGENCFAGSFGFYTDQNEQKHFALATGSFAINGIPSEARYKGGNNIYVLNPSTRVLDHVAKSDVSDQKAQLVTDIQWGFVDNDYTSMDLVAVSYPVYRENPQIQETYEWYRGNEQIHLDPDGTNPMSTYVWTSNPDLTTSLALGDINYGVHNPMVEGVPPNATPPTLKLIYVNKFPFARLLEVSYRNSSGAILEIWPATEGYGQIPVCYDQVNGWISINRTHAVPPGAAYIRVEYEYGSHPDLFVGNDGKNAVYFNEGGTGIANPPTVCTAALGNQPPYGNPITYQIPAWQSETSKNLMAKDAEGASVYEPGRYPNCRTFRVIHGWDQDEIFMGHYFWNDLDRQVQEIHAGNSEENQVIFNLQNTATWTIGNYIPGTDAQLEDSRNRTSDERLHAMYVRNMVNRYRPNGMYAQYGNPDPTWGTTWGVKHYAFEFEPDLRNVWSNSDYATYDEGCPALAEKMYRDYQMIKAIDPTLKVISPNFSQYGLAYHLGDLPEGMYMGPDMPYLNQLNNITGQYTHSVWLYCDYIWCSVHCAKAALDHSMDFQDPFVTAFITDHPELRLGIDQNLWGYYTEGLDQYFTTLGTPIGTPVDWHPVMRNGNTSTYYEKPFYLTDWHFFPNGSEPSPESEVYPQADWISSEVANLFAVDVFPGQTPAKDHYLVEYSVPWFTHFYPQVFEQCAKLLNDLDGDGMTFCGRNDQVVTQTPNDPVTVHRLVFKPREAADFTKYVHFVRTDYGPTDVTDRYVKTLFGYGLPISPNQPNNYNTEYENKIECYTPTGNAFQKVIDPDELGQGWINFQPGEMGPNMITLKEINGSYAPDYSQSISLHEKWNLVSWNIWPSGTVGIYQTIAQMLPLGSWISSNPGGKVYNYLNNLLYWPLNASVGDQWWYPDWAYYFRMGGPVNWQLTNKPHNDHHTINIEPREAWSRDHFVGEEMLVRWFFLGYTTNGYMKLASIPSGTYPCNGDPANFSYEGPLHWLIWWDSINHPEHPNYPLRDLKIVKTDEGKIYIPMHQAIGGGWEFIDQIGVLEPGKGYFLGFYCQEGALHEFEGWPDNPTWQNNSIEPKPNPQQSQVASAAHFQFNPFTHWSYPVMIDTVDLQETPLAVGDEIAAFDGDLCVGSVAYTDTFPMVLTTWEDDIATPMVVDGYIPGHTMTFKWYDASQNTEAEFILPPTTMSLDEDDPVTPKYSGFGRGAFGERSFSYGVQSVKQLPAAFKLCQNYPNPFNSSTIILLELPQRSKVRIEVFNVKGQRVGNVYESVENAGYPKVYYDASQLSSGVYFCRVTAEGLERTGKFSGVGKLVLLK